MRRRMVKSLTIQPRESWERDTDNAESVDATDDRIMTEPPSAEYEEAENVVSTRHANW